MFDEEENPQNPTSVRQYLSVLLTRRRLILSVFIVTVGITAWHTFTQAPIYRATGRIMIEPKKPEAMRFQDVYEATDTNRDYYETQYRLLKDRQLAERVFEDLGAAGRPEYAAADDPVALFMGGIHVAPLKKSRLVDVGYEHTDPVWACLVANAVVETYIEENQRRDFSTSERILTDLTRQAEELEAKLQASHAALQQFWEESDLVAVDQSESPSNIALDRLARLEEAVTQAQIKRITLAARYETTKRLVVEGGDNEKLASLVQGEALRTLRIKLAEAEQDRAKLAQDYLPSHPKVEAIERQIAAMKQSIADESQRILTTMRAEYERAKAEEESLNRAHAIQKDEVQKIGRLTTRYAILKMEAERSSRLYDIVLERIKEIDLTSEMERGGTNIFFIHRARVPDRAIRPNKRANLVLACLAGLVLGIGLALAVNRFDTSLKSKQDIEQTLSLPILGFVPAVKTGRRCGKNHPYLMGLHNTRSPIAETFRTICTGITCRDGGELARRLVITSATAREGKTLVAINLATALARSGEKVLLIDTDMRRPALLKVFDIRIWATLRTYLEPAGEHISLNEVVYSTEVQNLDVLPCGRPPKDPIALLDSPRMKQLVRDALSRYDRIVFDSPPCVGIADASVLAAGADATLMVVRAFETPRHLAQRAKEVIENVTSNIIGVIVNDIDAEKHGGYYGRGACYGRADYYGRTAYYADPKTASTVSQEEHQ